MWISHRKEIQKLTFRAQALRRSEHERAQGRARTYRQMKSPLKKTHFFLPCVCLLLCRSLLFEEFWSVWCYFIALLCYCDVQLLPSRLGTITFFPPFVNNEVNQSLFVLCVGQKLPPLYTIVRANTPVCSTHLGSSLLSFQVLYRYFSITIKYNIDPGAATSFTKCHGQ